MIERIEFNWFFTQEEGEAYSKYVVGQNCISIVEHLPMWEGDRLYYDIYLDDNTVIRTFNPNQIEQTKEN